MVRLMEQRIVVGYKGLIGQAVYKIFDADVGIDIVDKRTGFIHKNRFRIMHVCIPFIENYIDVVSDYIEGYQPKLTIIHTTCKVGSTRQLNEKTKQPVVHIPIYGHHTNSSYSPVSMVKDMFRYVMSVGAINIETGNLACDYVGRFGFKAELQTPETTEFAKIMSTNLQLDVIKSWEKHHKKVREYKDVDWNGVVNIIKDVAENEPYGYLNRTYQRLAPVDTKISGKHCLTENKDLL